MSEPGTRVAHAVGSAALPPVAPLAPAAPDPLARAIRAVLVVGCLVVLSISHGVDADLWGHVRYGQDVLAARALPVTASHTYTAVGHPWINHENLAELAFGWIETHLGAAGLNAFNTLLGFLVLGLMVRNAVRQRVSFLVLSVAILLATCAIGPGWSIRPQLFTYTFFALLVVILGRCFRDGERPDARALWLAPPLFALWANTHGGFLAGLAVLALYLGCHALAALWSAGRDGWREAGRYGLVLAACGLATLANPYGPRLLAWLVADLAPPRPEIGEWHRLALPDPLFVVTVALVGLIVAAFVGSRRPRDLGQVAVLAVTAWQSFLHARHPPFLGILAAFWLPFHLEGLRRRLKKATPARSDAPPPSPRAVRVLLGATWAMALLLLVTLAVQSRTLWVNRSRSPVDALQYMADRHLAGKLVVHFDWAQYALAALAPETTVAFDGRFRTCYPQAVADLYFDFLLGNRPAIRWRSPTSPPLDDTAILRLGDPDLVLLSRRFKHSVKVMRRKSGWVLLYQDRLAQLWGRPERYGDPAGPDYVPPAMRSLTDRRASGWETIVIAQITATPPRQSASSRRSLRRSRAGSTSSERS